MFHTILKTRRATPKHTHQSLHRLVLETLEDRVVPSLADGTVLVATAPSSFASKDQSSVPTGILGVNPSTGAQFAVSTGNLFSLPTYICEAPNGQLYVSDLTAFATGAIIQVDPNRGAQVPLAQHGFINGPNVLAFVNGFVYVANEGDGTGAVHNIIRIDPNTGRQTLITDGPHRVDGGTNSSFFTVPVGMVPAPGNNVYLADEQGSFYGPNPGELWEVNLDTGKQTLISSNNSRQGMLFNHAVDVAVDLSGNLLMANTGSPANNGAGSVFRINPQTGVQTLITSFGPYSGTDSVEVGPNGTIYVGAIASGPNPGQVIAVNPTTGAQQTLSLDSNLSLVEGMRTFHAPVLTAATTTSLASSANPAVYGQSVTFTAIVTASAPGSGTPTGTVQFQIDGTNFGSPVSLTSGLAISAATSSLSVSGHTVQAVYSGDTNFASSTGTLTQTINQAGTTTVVVSSANLSLSGQSVTFAATVSVTFPGSTAGANPTGMVTFMDGSTTLGTARLSAAGTASFSTTSLTVGTHTITASYSGENNFLGSSGTLTQTVETSISNSSTAVVSSANPSVSGQAVTFTATVTGSGHKPTGSVTFMDGSTTLAKVTLSAAGDGTSTASFTISALMVGRHTIIASYSGDGNYQSSMGTLTLIISQASSSTVVVSSGNPSLSGQSVTFTATVSVNAPGSTAVANPQGMVTFTDGSTTLGTVTLSARGTASFNTTSLTVGSHIITASYSGDDNFLSSHGTLTQAVNQPGASTSTTTAVSSSANPSVFGLSVTFTATVSAQSSGAGTPTGTVQFQIDGTNAGSRVTITSANIATYSTASLTVGTHTITASYSGDGNFSPSSGTLAGGQAVTSTATIMDDLGLLLLDPAGSPSLMVTGNGTVTVNGSGAVVVNSNNSRAAVLNGHGTVTAADIDVTGGTQTTGHASFSGPIDREPAVADPLGLALPSPPSPTFGAVDYSGKDSLTLQPGTYVGGIRVSGQASVTLAPGVYYLQGGGFSVSGKGSVTGIGVVIINAPGGPNDTISLTGQGNVTLSAPTSGFFQGITIFQGPASSNPLSFTGKGTVTLTGVIYVPDALVSIDGNGNLTINAGPGTAPSPINGALIASDLTVDGNGVLTINPDDPSGGGGASAPGDDRPLRQVSLQLSGRQQADGNSPSSAAVTRSGASTTGAERTALDQLFSSNTGSTEASLSGESKAVQPARSIAPWLDPLSGQMADELVAGLVQVT